MDRYYQANAVADAPAVPANNPGGYPANGNAAVGIDGTVPGAWWYHTITEELRNAIVALGGAPDFTQTDQLATALLARFVQPWVTPQDFDAVCDGETDDSAALHRALGSGKPVRHLHGVLAISSVTVDTTCDFEIAAGASVRLLPTGNASTGLTLNGPHSRLVAWGLIDGNLTGRTAVALGTPGGATADYAQAYLFNVQNVSGETFSGTHPSGIEINGGTGQKFYINARNFPNNLAGQTGSPARAATVEGHADRVVGEVDADNVWIGVVLATTTCHMTRVKVTNSGLEAVYNLNGDNTIGDVIYAGQYQAVVNEASVHVGRIFHTGGNPPTGAQSATNGGATIALQNATVTDVGLIQVGTNPALPVKGSGTLLIVRAGNVQSGPVRIGRVQGTMRPASVASLTYHGLVQEVSIQNVDLSVEYDSTVMTSPANFCDLTAAQEFSLRNWRMKVIDVNSQFPHNFFSFNLPGANLIRPGHFEDVHIRFYEADGATPADPATSAYLHVYGAANPLVYTRNQVWQGNLMLIREASAYGGAVNGGDTCTSVPVAGTWAAGRYMWNYAPVLAGPAGCQYVVRGWTCVAAGTPGTWVQDCALSGPIVLKPGAAIALTDVAGGIQIDVTPATHVALGGMKPGVGVSVATDGTISADGSLIINVTPAAAVALDLTPIAAGIPEIIFNLQPVAPATTLTFANAPATGTMALFVVVVANVAGASINWPASVRWPGGAAPALTGTAGKTDTFVLYTQDGGTTYHGFVAGQNQ
ncbi:hypothetical protein [Paraburkholderia caffeinilytica]|uniref:hypothetical protein n=1 Tax=Paraburkholderia caffeinilytica TaxID=1761016 RepID=UPI003DA1B154